MHESTTGCATVQEELWHGVQAAYLGHVLAENRKAWAKLKQLLRLAMARTQENLDQAIADFLKLISADNAKAWFRLCIKSYGNPKIL
jgi:hypothetical protein